MDVLNFYERMQTRSDMSNMVFHMTKPQGSFQYNYNEQDLNYEAIDTLIEIIGTDVLKGSKRAIRGGENVVCFQDVPFKSLIENVKYEQRQRLGYPLEEVSPKITFSGIGLGFYKANLFRIGARPVIYYDLESGNRIVEVDRYGNIKNELNWNVVKYDLRDEGNIIDWTYNREWRFKGHLTNLSSIGYIIVLNNLNSLEYFMSKISDYRQEFKAYVKANIILLDNRYEENHYVIDDKTYPIF
jgi:hypothetical protein